MAGLFLLLWALSLSHRAASAEQGTQRKTQWSHREKHPIKERGRSFVLCVPREEEQQGKGIPSPHSLHSPFQVTKEAFAEPIYLPGQLSGYKSMQHRSAFALQPPEQNNVAPTET